MLEQSQQQVEEPASAAAQARPAAKPKKIKPKGKVAIPAEGLAQVLDKISADALAKLTAGNYAALDPVIGDSACQLTAFAVVGLARKLSHSSLSPEEMQFLQANEILLSAREINNDVLCNITKDERNEKVIHPDLEPYLPDNKAKVTFTIEIVTKLIEFRIGYITNTLKADARLGELFAILADERNHQVIKRFSGSKIKELIKYPLKCLPCAATCEGILMSELLGNNPILITVKRMTRTILADGNQELRLQAMEPFMFKPNANRNDFVFCPEPSAYERLAPCIHFVGNSIVNIGESLLPFLNSQNFAAYREEFIAIDIMDKLRLCYIAHTQYPGKPSEDQQACYEKPNAVGNLADMFRTYKGRLQGECGIPENTMLYPTQKPGVLTREEMTFAIDHILADSFDRASARCESIMADTQGHVITGSYRQ